eukprot:6236394-Ditylum_brightwellii.AAC.1
MAPCFKRHEAPSALLGFNVFETCWNQEAGRWIAESLRNHDDNIILIHHKTTKQLQEYYDKMQ